MGDLLRHLRHALRSLGRSPVFTFSATLTLAVCIGANVAIFSIVDTLLVRPLPYPEPSRLVSLDKGASIDRRNLLHMDVAPWVREMQSFTAVGLFTGGTLNLAGGVEPLHVKAAMVSPAFFTVMGVRPALGRVFRNDDHQKRGAYAVVLSHRLWQTMFGADRSLPGRTVLVNGRPTVVVGIMPAGFDFPDGSALWVPATVEESPFLGGIRFRFVARLREGVTVGQARAEMQMVAARNAVNLAPNFSFDVVSLQEWLAGSIRPTLLLFVAAVALVLLVGCVNVANLVLARMAARRAEMAVRAALGAGRGALVRLAMTEVALVALAGGALGLVLARASLSTLLTFLPPEIPGLDRVMVDGRGAAFAFALSLVVVLLVGIVPALRMGGIDLQEATKGTAHGMRARHRYIARVFVVTELALAVLLSAGAALLGKSFLQLATADPGFKPHGVLTMTLSMMDRPYWTPAGPTARPAPTAARYKRILDRLRSIPGVEAAGATDNLPMNARLVMRASISYGDAPAISSLSRSVTPGYFAALAIPIVAGSDFTDRPLDHPTVIISRNLARRLWGKDWVPGAHIRLWDDPKEVPSEIVGVVGDVRSLGPEVDPPTEVYQSHWSEMWPVMTLGIRTNGDPLALARRVREEIRTLEPSVPVFHVETMENVAAGMVAPRRASMLVLALFAGCAVLLAVMGVYGVTSYLVGQQTREFGVRLALGARRAQVLAGVLRQSAVQAAIAAAVGMAGALALGRLLESFLVNVAPTDPAVLLLTCGVLILVAMLSSVAPARRAASVDPAITLRVE